MYPQNATQLAALLAALVPLVIGIWPSLTSARSRAQEINLTLWRRLNDVTTTLHKGSEEGLWRQMAAAVELGETKGPYRQAAVAVLESAKSHFAAINPTLAEAIGIALVRAQRPWYKRILNC